MNKRIVLDGTALLFPHIGVARVIQQLIDALLAQGGGYEYVLYSRCCLRGVPESLRRRYPFYHLPLPRLCEGLIRYGKVIERWTGGDLFHAIDHYMPVGTPDKTVITLHDVLFLKDPEGRWEAHRHFSKRVPSLAKSCRGIITCSEHSKRDIVEYLHIAPQKIDVIPWGIDRSLFYPADDAANPAAAEASTHRPPGPYLLAVGCSIGRKNTLRLLRCHRRLLEQGYAMPLVLVWEPPSAVKEQYAAARADGTVIFTGRVDDEMLRRLYQGASALLYPSYYEGFGLPILEAMACGTPVITSNCSSMPEVGGDAAFYVDPYSDDELLAAMLAVADGTMDLQGMRRRGLARAQKYCWERCAAQTVAVYDKFLQ